MAKGKPESFITMHVVAFSLGSLVTLMVGWLFMLSVDSFKALNSEVATIRRRVSVNTSAISTLEAMDNRRADSVERLSKVETAIEYLKDEKEQADRDFRSIGNHLRETKQEN